MHPYGSFMLLCQQKHKHCKTILCQLKKEEKSVQNTVSPTSTLSSHIYPVKLTVHLGFLHFRFQSNLFKTRDTTPPPPTPSPNQFHRNFCNSQWDSLEVCV